MFPRGRGVQQDTEGFIDPGDEYVVDDMPQYQEDDATSAGHLVIEQKKQILKYMRLIERDGPRLQMLQKRFVPPPDELPLIVREISYSGEEHPATRKQVIVVAVSLLPLYSPAAVHKLKLLAGARWSQNPPRDSGVGQKEYERVGKDGYIKISCEDFPTPAMNLKWGSDVVDDLISQANNVEDTFADIPLDRRHLAARARKAGKGEHTHGSQGHRPTIKDFPKEWLPQQQDPPPTSVVTQ